MDLNDKYMSCDYTELGQLSCHGNVTLIKRTSDGRLLVRKKYTGAEQNIYEQLTALRLQGIPEIAYINSSPDGGYEVYEQYIEGRTLRSILDEEKKLSESCVINFATQLCSTLSSLHKVGIVHRDVKPENIIITPDGKVVLIDFDIARTRKKGAACDTELLGTQGYAAPEQFGFRQSDYKVDIYAIGILINEMLTGALPIVKKANGNLGRVAVKCTELDPDRRYSSMAALRRHLCGCVPPSAPLWERALRSIPGFRSLTWWKMLIAFSFYALIIISVLTQDWRNASFMGIALSIGSALFYLALFAFVLDIWGMRSGVKWLRSSRSKVSYIGRCFLIWVTVLLLSSIILTVIITVFNK